MANDKYDELEKRVAALEKLVLAKPAAPQPDNQDGDGQPNWTLNERAFVTRYAHGKPGEKKFTLLVAYLAKGDPEKMVPLADVQKLWNRMTASSLLGSKFNRKYTSGAKASGWVNTPETGVYQLAYGWDEVLEEPGSGRK